MNNKGIKRRDFLKSTTAGTLILSTPVIDAVASKDNLRLSTSTKSKNALAPLTQKREGTKLLEAPRMDYAHKRKCAYYESEFGLSCSSPILAKSFKGNPGIWNGWNSTSLKPFGTLCVL
jgi:hypothetical protein